MSLNSPKPHIVIIGGGPAGLMAAEMLSATDVQVSLFDAMPSVGRKFLIAGKGGMNISNAEALPDFIQRYGAAANRLQDYLEQFDPDDLQAWLQNSLGISTFVGSSGRIFPSDLKAAPLLRAWLQRLRARGVHFHVRHEWLGWDESQQLRFNSPSGELRLAADALILALGGGSWAKLGSNSRWLPLLAERGVAIAPLQAANCGFESNWSAFFKANFAGQALKSIAASVLDSQGNPIRQKGEMLISDYGLEGGLVYALSAHLRETINRQGQARLCLDLLPELSLADIQSKLSQGQGKNSLANHLRKRLGLAGAKAALLREILSREAMQDPEQLAQGIKALTITLSAARPLDEAISSAGGVTFSALDQHLMLKALPSVFCAGEMLDWEAPTGGYLLTACFATGRAAGLGVLEWLKTH